MTPVIRNVNIFATLALLLVGCGSDTTSTPNSDPQIQAPTTQVLADLQGRWSTGCILDFPDGQSSDSLILSLSVEDNAYELTGRYYTDVNCVDPEPLVSDFSGVCILAATESQLPPPTGNTIVETGFLQRNRSELIPTPLGGATSIRVTPSSIETGFGESLDEYDCGDLESSFESMYLVSGDRLFFEDLYDDDFVEIPADIPPMNGDSPDTETPSTDVDSTINNDRERVLDLDVPYIRVQ